jgi:Acetyltransferase (GNAT) domain/Tetratricopeptide repeat
MHIDVIEDFGEFNLVRRNWEAVYQADPEAQYFLSWQWLADWLSTHPTIWFVLAAKRDKTDVEYGAFLALRMRTSFDKKHGFFNELFFGGDGFSDYNGILSRPEFEAEAVAAFGDFLKLRVNWARFTMENLTMSDQRRRLFFRCFDKLRFVHTPISYKSLSPDEPTDHGICPSIRLPPSWNDYLATLSTNNRQKIRRLLKKVDAGKECRIISSDANTFDQNLSTLLELWKIKWHPKKGDRADDICRRNYIMLSRCAENGTLFLPVFWHGERPVAALATIVDPCKKSLLFFVTGRDETYRELPAGYLLHAYSIRYAISRGFTTYDFLKGNEPYKYLFAPQVERVQKPLSVATKTGRNLGGKLDPRGLPAMLEMTLEYERQGEIADAERGYRQILELAPDNALALYRFGRLRAENGAHAEAKELLTRSVELEPEGDNAWFCLGQSLQALGDNTAAVTAYRAAVRLQPQNKQAKELLLELTAAAKPAQPDPAIALPQAVSPAVPLGKATDPGLVLQRKVEELRALTQNYFDAFVNPRPRI